MRDTLREHGIAEDVADRLKASGYLLTQGSLYGSGDPTPCIVDTFYGSKWGIGLTPVDAFFKPSWQMSPQVFEVSSLAEINAILATSQHLAYRDRMTFRGQVREYFVERPYPNPVAAMDGKERLIIPGFWRRFAGQWQERFSAQDYRSIFLGWGADHLVYYGIDEWWALPEKNIARYGFHTMSDLEDFPDPESQEYFKRWQAVKVMSQTVDLPIVEQHYGIDTTGLDVTFDPAVALFFATNKFQMRPDQTAFYSPTDSAQSVVYSFVFRDPPLTRTTDLVERVAAFDHIKPERPRRQTCALPFFQRYNINEVVADLHCIFRLSSDFDRHGIPSAGTLFPGPDEDDFYRAALELKRTNPGGPLKNIVEYRFEEGR